MYGHPPDSNNNETPFMPVENKLTLEIEAISVELSGSQDSLLEQAAVLASTHAPLFTGASLPVTFSAAAFNEYFKSIISQFDRAYAFQLAEADAAGFPWPDELLTRDMQDLAACQGDLAALVRQRQEAARLGRFNIERCQQLFADDPDYTILADLAINGARIFTAEKPSALDRAAFSAKDSTCAES